MQSDDRSELTASQQNIANAYAQEQQISQAFQLNNFYLNSRLNINQLKLKIEQQKQNQYIESPRNLSQFLIKRNKPYDLSPEKETVESNLFKEVPKGIDYNQSKQEMPKHYKKISLAQRRMGNTLGKQKKKRQHYAVRKKKVNSEDQSERDREEIYPEFQQRNTGAVQSVGKNINVRKMQQYRLKTTTLINEKNFKPKDFSFKTKQRTLLQDNLYKIRMARSKTQMSDSRMSWMTHNSYDLSLRIPISNNNQMLQFERKIKMLWQHYELLSRILQLVHANVGKSKYAISKYRQMVCSSKFQFIKESVELLCKGKSKKEEDFCRRLKKNIILSRLYQYFAIIFLALSFFTDHISMSNLTNLVGYASSNLILIIKLFTLSHSIEDSTVTMSPDIQEKMLVIQSFEIGSYGVKVNKIADVVMRVEQNNNVIGMIKNKLELERELKEFINDIVKVNQMQKRTLEGYSYHIFQYLAFWIATQNLYGQFQTIEIAPAPYLNLPKERTIIIQPWQVLFSMKGEKTFIRAYSDKFLIETSKYCNIVYWTDLLPNQINALIDKIPPGDSLYRYHCKYQDGSFIKELQRLGSNIDNTIIIDRAESNFKYDVEMGIALPWNGTKRNLMLLSFLELLNPFLYKNSVSFRKCFPDIKAQLVSPNLKKKVLLSKNYGLIQQNYRKMTSSKLPKQ